MLARIERPLSSRREGRELCFDLGSTGLLLNKLCLQGN
jgi:hypothetical protein